MSADKKSLNVLGHELASCSKEPMTGWFRDGSCRTDATDAGRHVVCARVTEDFLSFSRAAGNDLSTPRPQFRFPGLKPGDCWCLCAARFKEAYEAGCAPEVNLRATERSVLQIVPLEMLADRSIDE